MANEKKSLSLEEMKKISGGLVVNDKENNKYWVVREDGTVIGPAPDETHAKDYAKAFSVSQTIITLEDYKKRFGRDLVW